MTILLTFAFAIFGAGGLASGCLFVNNVADILGDAASSPGALVNPATILERPTPRPTVSGSSGTTGASANPETPDATATPELPPWRGTDRVTILLLGLDMREDERGTPTRSDTIILVTVDPATKRAGMLHIPRDLYVPIPGYGDYKINTAHFLGEQAKPGEGPLLAEKTIEYNFGVRINYYAVVDFTGFARLIDTIGGINLDVQHPFKDDEYPTADYGIRRILFAPGPQHLDGTEALSYARSRHADSDFGRGKRQEAVLFAARDQVLQPTIITRVPQMVGILTSSVKTDIPVTQILPLFNLGRSVDTASVVSRSIDASMVIDEYQDGTVLVPNRAKIKTVVDEVFGAASPTPTPLPTLSPTPRSTATSATRPALPVTINVYNGTTRDLLAASTGDLLEQNGYTVLAVDQASRSDYVETQILDHTGRSGVAARMASLLGVPSSSIKEAMPSDDGADLTIVIGLDYNP